MSSTTDRSDWEELSELFHRLLDLNVTERATFLAASCQGRPELAAELTALLAAAEDSSALALEADLDGALKASSAPEPSPRLGSALGPYRLLRLLSRGGMGEVHLAERADGAFAQRVAIKLMRPGLASAELIARFELERELLARLTHPAVVPLLDGGTAPDGRPYLVMQYVEGLPITAHCAARGLDRRERVRLLLGLCRAVQYAHAHLIVHRDLKPSNILVTPEGQIRLLDFGIAKLLADELSRRELTRAELVPMTPERAAPEQTRGEPVTTATDVWALGLLLHELATGHLPELANAGEPELTGLARKLGDRDLAAIVTRALRPEPERRYGSAGELANDLVRWLDHEPVLARPDSYGYRLNRLVSRHRGAVSVAALALVALALLTSFSAWQSRRSMRAHERAAAEQKKAASVLAVLADLLGAADPTVQAQGEFPAGAQLLERAVARAARLEGEPEVQARLRATLGRIYLERGEIARARPLLEQALAAERERRGGDDPALVELRMLHADILHKSGEVEAARRELLALREWLEARPDADPLVLAQVLLALATQLPGPEADAFAERALALQRAAPAPDPLLLGASLTLIAVRRGMHGDAAGARALHQETLELERPILGEDDPRILATRSNLAVLLPDPRERVAEHRQIIEARTRVLGERSQAVAMSWGLLGQALAELGEWRQATASFRKSRETWLQVATPTHSRVLAAGRFLAWALERDGQDEAALAAYRALAREAAAQGVEPNLTLLYRAELAGALLRAGEAGEAEAEANAVLGALDASGIEAPRTRARAALTLGLAQLARAEAQPAAGLLASEHARAAKSLEAGALELAQLEAGWGRALAAQGRGDEARRALERALQALESNWLSFPAEVAAARAALHEER